MDFEVIGEMTQVETIASGSGVRDRAPLRFRREAAYSLRGPAGDSD